MDEKNVVVVRTKDVEDFIKYYRKPDAIYKRTEDTTELQYFEERHSSYDKVLENEIIFVAIEYGNGTETIVGFHGESFHSFGDPDNGFLVNYDRGEDNVFSFLPETVSVVERFISAYNKAAKYLHFE